MNQTPHLLEVINTRRSIRDFKEGDIPQTDIERILEAGIMAPSPGNRQPWRFHVMQDKVKKKFVETLEQMKNTPWFWQIIVTSAETVPIVIAVENPLVVLRRTNKETLDNLSLMSVGTLLGTAASIENMLLAIHALGYGSTWLSFPTILDAAKEVTEIRGDLIAVLPVGRPAEVQHDYVDRTRVPVKEVTTFYH